MTYIEVPKAPPGLEWWGSDCVLPGGCSGNATPESMTCDSCGSYEHTVPMYVLADAGTEIPALTE